MTPAEKEFEDAPHVDAEREFDAAPPLPTPEKSKAERALGVLQSATELNPMSRVASWATHPDRARSSLAGYTANAAPYILAGMEGVKGALTPGETFSGNYDKALPDYKKQYRKAVAENPLDNLGGAVLQPNPVGKTAAGAGIIQKVGMAGARVAQSAGLGGLSAYLGGEQDPGNAAIKTGGIQAGSEAVSPVLGKVAGAIAQKAQAADSRAGEMVAKDAMALYNKATGSLGGEVAAGRNAEQVMNEILSNPNATATQKQAAQSLIDDPGMMKMLHRVYDNAIQALPGRLGKIQNAEQGVQEAAAKNTPEALAAAKAEMMADPIGKRVVPSILNRAKRHVLPAVGGALGVGAAHVLGVDPLYGYAAGGLLGHTSKQLLSHPSVAAPLLSGAESVVGGMSKAAQASGAPGLEQWLTKKPDDEREKEGADNFSKAMGGR